MARFLFGPINKMNGGGQMGRVANRNLITAEQIELRAASSSVWVDVGVVGVMLSLRPLPRQALHQQLDAAPPPSQSLS